MSNDVLVVSEVREGSLKRITLEMISAARMLASKSGGKVCVALISSDSDNKEDEVKDLVDGKVLTAKSAALTKYSTGAYAKALEAIIKESSPSYVLFGATAMGKDLSARIAARLNAALFTDCTDIDLEGSNLRVKRPVYSGKVYAEAIARGEGIQMASVRPNIYSPAEAAGSSGEVVNVGVTINERDIKAVVKEIVASSGGRKDITEAEIIVSGGRALKSAENFKILEELADVLGASVGASRAAVDAGYAPHLIQVGQTGKVVNPKLYIAIGISGAIQHIVGMRTSKVIVAINKDENAPIFQKADYGIVGDLFEVVPLLTEEFKKLLAS